MKILKTILLVSVFLGLTLANEECDERRRGSLLSTKALVNTCSGWALNRLPQVKEWIQGGRAANLYPNNVEIKYVGGDPRIAFVRTYEEECYLNGQLMGINQVVDVSDETKINDFNAERIEAFLAENGVMPSGQRNEELWRVSYKIKE